MKIGFLALLCALFAGGLFAQQQPTETEMAFIYELNRARNDPQRYDTENNLNGLLNGVQAQPPLALNLNLVQSARFHSDEMATNGYFAHQSTVTGDWPNKMVRDAGYPLNSGLPNNTNNLESLAARYSSASSVSYTASASLLALIEDVGVNPPGHRIHLLAMNSFNENFREIGTGYAEGIGASGWASGAYWSIHTGYRDSTMIWLTGVVYDDANTNGRYDQGEGLSGVTVSVNGGGSMISTTGGGWSISVSAGTHNLTCSGGAFSGTATATVTVNSNNMAVDFVSGTTAGEVDFGNQVPGGPGPGPGGGGGDSGGDSSSGGCAVEDRPGRTALFLLFGAVLLAGWRLALLRRTS